MKHALITGGAGFIGSHLADALLLRGDHVTVLDDESTGRLDNLLPAMQSPHFEFVSGSAGDAALVERLVAEVDDVYHLAAAVGVALIARAPIETIERNIAPTQLILNAVHRRNAAGRPVKFFLASTSEVYGKNPKLVWNEEDDLVFGATTRARWSYGASKAIDEFLALAHCRQFQAPIVIGRFFNVVGPRQSGAYGMVLPRFVQAALAGQALIVHDDGRQTRCFAHVQDVVRAVIQLMDCPEAQGQVTNIGSNSPVTILDLARRVITLSNSSSPIEFQSYAQAYDQDFEDIRHRVPDLAKLKQLIDYSPQYDLDAIIKDVLQFYA